MNPNLTEEEGVDFSHYKAARPSQGRTGIAVVPGKSYLAARKIVMLIILIATVLALAYLAATTQTGARVIAPTGYRIIESPNAPPRLEKTP